MCRYVCAVYVAFFWCVTIPSLCTIFHWAKIEILYIVEYIFNAIAHNCVIKINVFYFVNCKFLIYDECYRLFYIKWIAANLSPIYFSDGIVEKCQSILNNVDSSIKKISLIFSAQTLIREDLNGTIDVTEFSFVNHVPFDLNTEHVPWLLKKSIVYFWLNYAAIFDIHPTNQITSTSL